MKIQGYYLYSIFKADKDGRYTMFPVEIYKSLASAQNSRKIAKYEKENQEIKWAIRPLYESFDRTSKVKYMRENGKWTTELNKVVMNDINERWNIRYGTTI